MRSHVDGTRTSTAARSQQQVTATQQPHSNHTATILCAHTHDIALCRVTHPLTCCLLCPRAAASLQRLSSVLSSPQLASPLHPSFFDSLQTARARYKQLLIHMHVQHCMRRQNGELGDDEQDEEAEGDDDSDSEVGRRSHDMRRIAKAAELSF